MVEAKRIRKQSRSPKTSLPRPVRYRDVVDSARIDVDAVKVLRRLTRAGHEAYLVGGGVRDLILGRLPKDFDIATSAEPGEVRKLFRNCRLIGRRFRLAHILFGRDKVIEVATFRKDPSQSIDIFPPLIVEGAEPGKAVRIAPSRRQGEFSDLLIRSDNVFGLPHEDAIRRDFTINGLYYDLSTNEVLDYVGGMPDLLGQVVRTIGDADVRFREDPVRILRAIKFGARLDLGIAPEVYDAMVEYRHDLRRAARPRLLEELLRFLRGGAAQRSIYLSWEVGVMAELLPELGAYLDDRAIGREGTWDRLIAIDALRADGRECSDAVLVAALLYGPLMEVSERGRQSAAIDEMLSAIGVKLAMPRRIRERVRVILATQRHFEQHRHQRIASRDFFEDAAMLFTIRCMANGKKPPRFAFGEKKQRGKGRPRPRTRTRPNRRGKPGSR